MSTIKKSTPRYHKIAHGSSIDESLFGDSNASKTRNTNGKQTTRKIVTGPVDPTAVVISENELSYIKNSAVITTEEQIRAEKLRAQKLKDERMKKANARKSRMFELEALARKNAKKSESEIAKEARDKAILDMAEGKLTDDTDLVKLLTTLGTRAAAFTIRDRQIEEKKEREEAEKEYNRRLDMEMELDRVKDLRRRDDEESAKRSKRFEDRKVITHQIEERRRAKVLQLEAREQDNQAQRAMKAKHDEDDKMAAARRKKEVEASRLEVMAANAESIKRKEEVKQHEREEMEEILRYQEKRAAEMARREEEEMLAAHRKKEAQLRMLAQQERNQDKQSEIDELRARRAAEEKERSFRLKEKETAQKRKNDLISLTAAREKQADDRRKAKAAEKAMDMVEYDDALAHTKKMMDREMAEQATKERMAEEHRIGIRNQIEEREEKKKRDMANKFDDGSGNRAKFIADQAKLETIREKMVKDLEDQGVNPRYLTEMRAIDIKKILNR